ncbi:hypothetical protein KSS87_008097 [Heliosperma pusillum]|nr:hypothetical protein KSS87_008097 [Heliosperma pusillum]
MDRQLANHFSTVTKLTLMGKGLMLNKCLYTVNMGSNDFINNYFLPQHYSSSSRYSPEQYAQVLIQIYMHGTNGSLCVDNMNDAANMFNQNLISLVDRLNFKLPGSQFTYINSISTDTGSAIADISCCKIREDFQCQESENVCEERENYIFWDGFHTTQMANIATAEKAFNAIDSNIVHPMNINTLLSTNDVVFINKTIVTNYISSSK